ncbi:MAG: glutamine synthetase family protein, partial [Mycoplasmatales bacterium]
KLKKLGFSNFKIGLEPEFFLFEKIDPNKPEILLTDMNGYFDQAPSDRASLCRREIVLQLEKIGFEIEANHHEVAASQHEINFKYDNVLEYCDKVQIFKNLVKTIAIKHGMHATFMPKPIHGVNGSGMHSNLSLFKDGQNVFYDKQGKHELSDVAYNFIGGLLTYAKEFTAITNPLVNSYKRLVPGYEAPCYVSYSNSNRSAMIRIPASRGQGTRVEVRSVDATANVYLAMATLLGAGLTGVEQRIIPSDPVSENIFAMTMQRRKELEIGTLPVSLREAIKNMEKSEFMKNILGEEVFCKYVKSKNKEYDDYRYAVHKWEVDKYLGIY